MPGHSRSQVPTVLPEGWKSANIRASSRFFQESCLIGIHGGKLQPLAGRSNKAIVAEEKSVIPEPPPIGEFSGVPKPMEIVMAICVLFECPGVTQAQYDEALKKLTGGRAGKALADWSAPGLLSHVAGPTPNGWRVVDVWESEADLMKFAGVLMPILKSLGFPEISPEIIPAHNFVKS